MALIISDGLRTSTSLDVMIDLACVHIRHHDADAILNIEPGMLELL